MENEKELKLKPKNNAKPKPTPNEDGALAKLKELRDKGLEALNTVVDYAVDNAKELYNAATNVQKPTPKPQPERVQLTEEFVAQKLMEKLEVRDTKEVVLNNKNPSNNMTGSSLVVEMEANKIESTIRELDAKVNANSNPAQKPVNKIDAEPEVQPKKESEAQPVKKENNETRNSFKATSKLRPEPPKPSPKPTPKPKFKTEKEKRLELEAEQVKTVANTPKPNIESNIIAMRNKFMRKQEEAPVVLEEQKFQTVLKPQDAAFVVKQKDAVSLNVANMRKNNQPGSVADVVEDAYGVEQRKMKAKLR